jgi:hypothetical protein
LRDRSRHRLRRSDSRAATGRSDASTTSDGSHGGTDGGAALIATQPGFQAVFKECAAALAEAPSTLGVLQSTTKATSRTKAQVRSVASYYKGLGCQIISDSTLAEQTKAADSTACVLVLRTVAATGYSAATAKRSLSVVTYEFTATGG